MSRQKAFLLLALTSSLVLSILQLTGINFRKNFYLYHHSKFIDHFITKNSVSKFGGNCFIRFGVPRSHTIKIAVTSCGAGHIFEQTLTMIKSAIIFSQSKLHFIIVVDNNAELYAEKIFEWSPSILHRITFEIISAQFPRVSNPEYWKQAFKPCASQRLFYSILLPNYDSIIHVDGDVLFLAPVEQLWDYFNQMNSTQILAMATEDMNPKTSWYKNSKTAPTPTEYSLNTGIILMNLTRMRKVNFFYDLEPIVIKYKYVIKWFVNDVIGVYLHNNPDKYLELDCRWNYLTDHCSNGQMCESAQLNGVAVVHGSRNTFFWETQPSFRAIYWAFRDYEFNTKLKDNLLMSMKRNLNRTLNTKCGQLSDIFIKSVENLIQNQTSLH